MSHEKQYGEERPHTSASQPQKRKDIILIISGICILLGLLLFVLGGEIARSQTPGAGLISFGLASLLFIGGVAVFILELVVRHASAKPR
jgi:uncharacterized membrane protein